MTDGNKVKRFEKVALSHIDAAYNLARCLTKNDHDAQDIAQEAYLRAFRFFDSFNGEDGRAWLLTIVRNTYFTWRQKNSHRAKDESYEEESHGRDDSNPALVDGASLNNPETLLVQRSSAEIINKALERLPLDSREVIVLRELEELSYKEIAATLKVPIGTVMSRLARARSQLKTQVEQINAESNYEMRAAKATVSPLYGRRT